MAVIFTKAYYTPNGGAEIDITRFIVIQQKRGTDLKSSKLDFTISNSAFRDKTLGDSIFSEDSYLEVYVDYSPITRSSNQLLLSGQIRQLTPSIGSGGSQYKFSVADKTVLLLGSLWGKEYSSGETAAQIIQNVINHVGNGEVTTNNVSTTKSTGGAFPSATPFSMSFRPVYDWVSQLSQPQYTGEDKAMNFYVDKNNDLHWFYPSDVVDADIVEGTDTIYAMSLDRNADAMVNMVIFNAGTDMNGNGVLWYYRDLTSKSNILRMKYQPMTDLALDAINREIKIAGNLVESSSGSVPFQGKLYALTHAGDFTTSWGDTVNGLSEYNDSLRTYLKDVAGTQRAMMITQRFGKLLWNGNITLRGSHNYVAGDLISLTTKSLGLNAYHLRIVDVTHQIDRGGWQTSLQLKEDEAAA